ncbi:DUF2332 domain-containing protein [Paenibacillus antri]|uniref:DUF2332 domain-containing protein n=1 Tax=Paenibacillus antri TaxID=2582848 RepID=A0A5R9GC82_9BACL|nr:DUF2332 domain-containing protein [Paenibacillus antri]TLS50744.1 DUF2332 domain-containing protein [Paenibacillus antri]
MEMHVLSERFRGFAAKECKGSSSLYEHLAGNIADDATLLRLAAQSRMGQPVPNLFLGAVHYLLLEGVDHPLAEYYPSIVREPRESSTAIHRFKDFCKQYEQEIIQIIQTKLVQTNEVSRCAYLYPSFCYISKLTERPLALIEIGTSAGLQLLWDKYSYSYVTDGPKYGNESAVLEIASELRGDKSPFLFKRSPPVASRIGIDLHVNDLAEPEDYLWLKALIWPEHQERLSRFEKAASCLEDESLELLEGDGVALLPEIASNIRKDSTLCVFHTHVANQMTHEARIALEQHFRAIGKEREVFHLYNNMWDLHLLHLDYYKDGMEYKETLAQIDGHGRSFQWLL